MASLLKRGHPLLRSITSVKQHVPAATIVGKAMRPPDYSRPPPYPYAEKDYTGLQFLWDKTTFRWDVNTALIVVEGPFGAGKKKFAEDLADKLDFKFMPDLPIKESYVFSNFDRTLMDPHLPERLRSFQEPDFHRNPLDYRVTRFQHRYLALRLKNYLDALTHICNTGQGVVMTRSVYSNYIYVDAMIKLGLIPPAYRKYYDMVTTAIVPRLWRPHLLIYLDTPFDKCMENIQKRGRDYEQGSMFFTKETHDLMHQKITSKYMDRMSYNSHIMSYDNTRDIDVDDVVYDIEQLPWYSFLHSNCKAVDWCKTYESDYGQMRIMVTSRRSMLTVPLASRPAFDVPEMHPHTFEDELTVGAALDKFDQSHFKYDPLFDPTKHKWWEVYLKMGPFHKKGLSREAFAHPFL